MSDSGQSWMNKGQREWQAWTDERHAQAAAERLALGTPVAVEHHGWGGSTRTEEESEVAELSGEGTSDKSAQARSDDNRASAKAQKLNTYNGARVSDQTRDGRCKLLTGISSWRVVDCRPLHYSVQDT